MCFQISPHYHLFYSGNFSALPFIYLIGTKLVYIGFSKESGQELGVQSLSESVNSPLGLPQMVGAEVKVVKRRTLRYTRFQ